MFCSNDPFFTCVYISWIVFALGNLGASLAAVYVVGRFRQIWPIAVMWFILTPAVFFGIFALPKPTDFGDENFLAFFLGPSIFFLVLASNVIGTILALIDFRRLKRNSSSRQIGFIIMLALFFIGLVTGLLAISSFRTSDYYLTEGEGAKALDQIYSDIGSPASYVRTGIKNFGNIAHAYYKRNGSSYLGLEDCLRQPTNTTCRGDSMRQWVEGINFEDEFNIDFSSLMINTSADAFCISHVIPGDLVSYACSDAVEKYPFTLPTANCGTSALVCPQ